MALTHEQARLRDQAIRALYMSDPEVSIAHLPSVFNVSRGTAYRILRDDPATAAEITRRARARGQLAAEERKRDAARRRKTRREYIEDRNEEIERAFRTGQTYHEIGAKYDLSRERVRQILASRGVTAKEGGKGIQPKLSKARAQLLLHERSLERRGMSVSEYKELVKKHGNRPYLTYSRFRANHKRKGAEFPLSFYEWWVLWQASGKTPSRKGWGMTRIDPTKPYTRDNVNIEVVSEITSRYRQKQRKQKNAPAPEGEGRTPSIALGEGGNTQDGVSPE